MTKEEPSKNLRPPIVSILGHVDHGKTTLLDTIRKANVAGKEHGGITQHIGAYEIEFNSSKITFVDTPGHAAFEKMRSRGAEVADIAVLVVAANDSVKPQTVEAIKHIKKSNRPMIVAATKIDLEEANVEKLKKDLQTNDVLIEQFGGDVPFVEVSAPKEKGIAELLETIQLVWQINPEKSEDKAPLQAVVVESFVDKSRGAVSTVIVKKGTLSIGDKINVDNEKIKVRALIDDNGKQVKTASPGKPVEILGFKSTLDVGSIVGQDTKTSRNNKKSEASIQEIISKAQATKEQFKILIKADVEGSLEAIKENLPEEVMLLDATIGEISTKDITLAKTANAPILAFNLKTSSSTNNMAQREGVVIKEYKVIYELIDDVKLALEGFAEAKHESKIIGKAKIVAVFNIEGQKIAGVKVNEGKLKVGDKIHLKSSQGSITEVEITSIKKFRKEVQTATAGQECGIGFKAEQLDFKEGDIIESLG